MAGTRNLFASVTGLALLGAPAGAHASRAQAPNLMSPPADVAVMKYGGIGDTAAAGSPGIVSGRIKVNPAEFKGAGCGALFLKIDVVGRPPEFTRAKGNPATGTCFYAFRTPPLKGPTSGQLYMKFDAAVDSYSFNWGAARPVEVAPGKHVVRNAIYMKF